MGGMLPKAVEAAVVERQEAHGLRVGLAELNGWRNNMEDAHLIFIREDWAFFGVFDGHGGEACSAFVAKRLAEELEKKGCPADDAAMKKLVLDVDQEFLDSNQPSGSTATMCIVHKPAGGAGKYVLRVANAGDSRILLGRRDGTIVDGGGTDQGLTTDHKPDHPPERERIYRCGGKVEDASGGGVARVNGDLAVSRGFGDRSHKQTGGPGPEDRPVTADPEFGRFECDEADFLMLVCDGVSEGNFPNPEVIQFAASEMKNNDDLGAAARAVCHKAVERDSKDNISCMIVLLNGSPDSPASKSVEFYPGPIDHLGNKGFRQAYEAMASRAGLSLAKAVEQRCAFLQAELKTNPTPALREEAAKIGTPVGEEGSAERSQWAEDWLKNLPPEEDGGQEDLMNSLLEGKGKGKGGGKGYPSEKGGGKPAPEAEEKEVERDEEGYTWSQRGEEVQILFKLPKAASKKDVKVNFKASSVTVAVHGSSLLDGQLGGKVDIDDCTWCLASAGSELQVMLTKKDAKDNWASLVK